MTMKNKEPTKICNRCKQNLSIDMFHKNKNELYGVCARCKKCCQIINKKFYIKNRENISKKQKKYRENNREKINNRERIYRNKNREKINEHHMEYYRRNKEKIKERYGVYVKKIKERLEKNPLDENRIKVCNRCKKEFNINMFHKDVTKKDGLQTICKRCQQKTQQKYYQEHKVEVREMNKKWRKENPEKSNAIYARYRKTEKRRTNANKWARNKENRKKQYIYRNKKYYDDIQYNLNIKFRRHIYMTLKKQSTNKCSKTIKLLGCNFEEYKQHIEKQFTEGMTWEKVLNGKIQIDHILPVNTFNLTKPEEQKKCFHYSNLRPLFAKDNLSRPKDGSDIA